VIIVGIASRVQLGVMSPGLPGWPSLTFKLAPEKSLPKITI
jgi:hypothetical protein